MHVHVCMSICLSRRFLTWAFKFHVFPLLYCFVCFYFTGTYTSCSSILATSLPSPSRHSAFISHINMKKPNIHIGKSCMSKSSVMGLTIWITQLLLTASDWCSWTEVRSLCLLIVLLCERFNRYTWPKVHVHSNGSSSMFFSFVFFELNERLHWSSRGDVQESHEVKRPISRKRSPRICGSATQQR